MRKNWYAISEALGEKFDEVSMHAVLKRLVNSRDRRFNHKVALLVEQYKFQPALPYLVRYLAKKENRVHTDTFIWACAALDCSEYYDFFFKYCITGSILSAQESYEILCRIPLSQEDKGYYLEVIDRALANAVYLKALRVHIKLPQEEK